MKVMSALSFNLVKPTSMNFIDMMSISNQNRSMALYLTELATLEGLSLKYTQSVIATASINLSDNILKTKSSLTGLSEKISSVDVMDCFKELCKYLGENNKFGLKAILRKYCHASWHNVGKYKLEANHQDK